MSLKGYLFFMIIFIFRCISGHGKFETLGALGISCMLLATGGGIAWHAVDLLTVCEFKTPISLLCHPFSRTMKFNETSIEYFVRQSMELDPMPSFFSRTMSLLHICRDCSQLALKWLPKQWHMSMYIATDMADITMELTWNILYLP
jgi:hypothetical protein